MKKLLIIWTTLALMLAPAPVLPELFTAHVQDSMEEVISRGVSVESTKRVARLSLQTPRPSAIRKGINKAFTSHDSGPRFQSCPLHIRHRALLI